MIFFQRGDEVLMMCIVIWLINGHMVDIGVLVTYVKIWDDVIKNVSCACMILLKHTTFATEMRHCRFKKKRAAGVC